MRTKEQVITALELQKKKHMELKDLGHARLLLACANGCLWTELKNYKNPYRFGNFEFSVWGHDTGIDYKISVVAPDDTTLTVRHINFSYAHSNTIHTQLYGAWDKPLENVLEDFRKKQEDYLLNKISELEELLEVFKREEKVLKDKFEAVFK